MIYTPLITLLAWQITVVIEMPKTWTRQLLKECLRLLSPLLSLAFP